MSEVNATDLTKVSEGKRFINRAEQAKEAVQALIEPLHLKSLTEFTFLNETFSHAGSYRGRTVLNYNPEHKPKLESFDEFEAAQIEPKNLKSGDLILAEYVMPGWEKRNIRCIFAGVVDRYEPQTELIKDSPGVIKFKRGILITDSRVISRVDEVKTYDAVQEWGKISLNTKIPLSVITEFININLGKEFEGFDEKALYDILVESVGKFNKENGEKLEIHVPESMQALLYQKKEATESTEQLRWIESELADGGKTTFQRIEAGLRSQEREIKERLGNLDQERQQYIADLEYTQNILRSLKDKAKKAPPRTEETLKADADLRELFKTYGFDLSTVNPLFFSYYKSLIITIAEAENRPGEYIKGLKASLEVSPERVIEAFPEIFYPEKILQSQATFTKNVENFLVNIGDEKKGQVAKKIERLYFKYFHPDSNFTPFEKKLIQELCKIGSPLYAILRKKYPCD